MDSKTFLQLYHDTKKEETTQTDCFVEAGIRRKTLALNIYGCSLLRESCHSTEYFVNEDLSKYANIVDCKDSGGVNNYADHVLSILSNFQNDERSNWRTSLNKNNYVSYIKNLKCSGDVNCQNSTSRCNLDSVKHSIMQYEKNDNPKLPDATEIKTNSSNYYKKPTNFNEVRNIQPMVDKPQHSLNFQTRNVQPAMDKTENDSNSTKNQSTVFFRSAKTELQVQAVKKFGKNVNINEKYNLGSGKKFLGTRKNGGSGKFQPPFRVNEPEETKSKMEAEADELVDERLKNIDSAMIETIKNEIMDLGSKVTWDDIAGLNLAKNTIQEIVVWPMLRPDIFTGLRRPPKGILLFGPPGTGKTLIGKCIASQSNSTFFSISASSLTSKWVGDGEKMVRTLFAVAKVYQPSVIFIDEIDSLLTQRSDSDHECSRRIKTEFLVQLDGAGTGDEDRILIIGATNRPQELDEAARRRLVKRLYIPLPDEDARKQIIKKLISTEKHSLSDSEIENIARQTKGYSGADVKNLCQEASLGPIRSISPAMIQSINPEDVRPLNAKDFESALCRIKSSVSEKDLDIYLNWDKQYGCGSEVI